MDIGLLNVRITILKNAVTTDAIGNHKNEWVPFYTCYATVSGEAGKEETDAGTIVDDSKIDFTIRWCKKAQHLIPHIIVLNLVVSFMTSRPLTT